MHNPALDQLKVTCRVGPLRDFKNVQPDSEAPVNSTREISFNFPSALLEVMHEPKAKGLDRGEMMRTMKGVENKRCALVQLFSIRQLEQAKTF